MLVVKDYSISSFVSHSGFLCQLHAHTRPLYNVLLIVGCCCLARNKCDIVRRVTELHLSTKVSHLSVLWLVSYARQTRKGGGGHARAIPIYTVLLFYVICDGLQMMMTLLQEIKGLTLYLLIHSRWKSSFHANFQVHCSHGIPVLSMACIIMYRQD